MLRWFRPLQIVTMLCRKALRGAASSFEESQPFMQPKHNFSDPSSLHKDCDFTLDLKAVVAAKAGSGSPRLPLPSSGPPLDSQGLPPDSTEVSELNSVGSRWLGRFWRPSSHEKHVQPRDLILNGTLLSGNCGVQLQINTTTTHIEVYEAKVVNYTFMVTALTFVQVHTKHFTYYTCSHQACLSRLCLRSAVQCSAVQCRCLNGIAAFHVKCCASASSMSKRSLGRSVGASPALLQSPFPLSVLVIYNLQQACHCPEYLRHKART